MMKRVYDNWQVIFGGMIVLASLSVFVAPAFQSKRPLKQAIPTVRTPNGQVSKEAWFNDDPAKLEASPFSPDISLEEHDQAKARLRSSQERINNLRENGKLVDFMITSGGLPLNSADGGSAEIHFKFDGDRNPRLIVISCRGTGQGIVDAGENHPICFTCFDSGETLVELQPVATKSIIIKVLDGGCISSIKLLG